MSVSGGFNQVVQYDRNLGISYWTKNYRTGLDLTDVDALNRVYPFYDPIDSLPAFGQAWWRRIAVAHVAQHFRWITTRSRPPRTVPADLDHESPIFCATGNYPPNARHARTASC